MSSHSLRSFWSGMRANAHLWALRSGDLCNGDRYYPALVGQFREIWGKDCLFSVRCEATTLSCCANTDHSAAATMQFGAFVSLELVWTGRSELLWFWIPSRLDPTYCNRVSIRLLLWRCSPKRVSWWDVQADFGIGWFGIDAWMVVLVSWYCGWFWALLTASLSEWALWRWPSLSQWAVFLVNRPQLLSMWPYWVFWRWGKTPGVVNDHWQLWLAMVKRHWAITDTVLLLFCLEFQSGYSHGWRYSCWCTHPAIRVRALLLWRYFLPSVVASLRSGCEPSAQRKRINYNDLTATSLETWLVLAIIPI